MRLTNDSFIIWMGTKNFTERYYRDQDGWLKVSARGRKFRMTAEQVLNHLLPAAAGVKPNLTPKVEHLDHTTVTKRLTSRRCRLTRGQAVRAPQIMARCGKCLDLGFDRVRVTIFAEQQRTHARTQRGDVLITIHSRHEQRGR